MKRFLLAAMLVLGAACTTPNGELTGDGGDCGSPPALAAGELHIQTLSCAAEITWNGRVYGVSGGKFHKSWIGERIAGQGETEYAAAYRLRTFATQEVMVLEARRNGEANFQLAFAHENSWDAADEKKVTAPYRSHELANEDAPETELSREFEFQPYPGSRWYGPDDSEVDQDSNIINAITGPDHCDWQSAVMMHVGWPLGHDAADSSEARQYLRDPEGLFGNDDFMSSFDAEVDLPPRAEYTGYRTDFMELWLEGRNEKAAYLVFADHVERWPRAREPIACA